MRQHFGDEVTRAGTRLQKRVTPALHRAVA